MALLVNPSSPNTATESKNLQAAAQKLGLQLHLLNVSAPGDLDPVFAKLHDLGVAALMTGQDVMLGRAAAQLGKLSVRYKIAAITAQRDFVAAGGLMSYGANQHEEFRRAGIYAGRILKGERPSDLPVMQSTKFDLVMPRNWASTCRCRYSAAPTR
jgi:putative ABC transport system substrate-binding protein